MKWFWTDGYPEGKLFEWASNGRAGQVVYGRPEFINPIKNSHPNLQCIAYKRKGKKKAKFVKGGCGHQCPVICQLRSKGNNLQRIDFSVQKYNATYEFVVGCPIEAAELNGMCYRTTRKDLSQVNILQRMSFFNFFISIAAHEENTRGGNLIVHQ